MKENMQEKTQEQKEKKLKAVTAILIILILIVSFMIIVNNIKDKRINQNAKISNMKQEQKEKNSEKNNEKNNEKNKDKDQTIKEDEDENSDSNAVCVQEIDKERFKELEKEEKTILLDFYATWCAPCLRMSAEVKKAKESGIPIYKVDVDKNPELAAQFNVRAMPTVVAVKKGKPTNYSVGYMEFKKIEEFYNKVK